MLGFALVLGAASALFFLRSSLEVFILTPLLGPQMLFFSLAHTWPLWAILLFGVSYLAYLILVLLMISAAAARWVTQPYRASVLSEGGQAESRTKMRIPRLVVCLAGRPGQRTSWLIYGTAVVLLMHFVGLMTYGYWSEALFAPGG